MRSRILIVVGAIIGLLFLAGVRFTTVDAKNDASSDHQNLIRQRYDNQQLKLENKSLKKERDEFAEYLEQLNATIKEDPGVPQQSDVIRIPGTPVYRNTDSGSREESRSTKIIKRNNTSSVPPAQGTDDNDNDSNDNPPMVEIPDVPKVPEVKIPDVEKTKDGLLKGTPLEGTF